ncbi:Protein kinase domain containing protein [Reticulomyxa filosa]|uniref:Protein kinase domain containing protein n=1 Tax=Reticulomyxa filosa TaxID=46433 RepID=X6NZW2_RETFI|nr:Protein kinase domain containing protein [Reticulomyxa filosa]|eukprot:ETO30837.1 Protein kinase domain containing protein [Reticulomyxa filosa]
MRRGKNTFLCGYKRNDSNLHSIKTLLWQEMAKIVDDQLLLAKNPQCMKMLEKTGHNFPLPEKVLFSDNVIKVNKRDKEQERVLLVTDKAVYNLKPKDYQKCQRRIAIDKIVSISEAKDSDEFTVHVPEEYDYLFKTLCSYNIKKKKKKCAQQKSKHRIIEIISQVNFVLICCCCSCDT